jgi:hypothetical protein
MDPLRWTPHMKECLDTLAHSEESSGDGVLAQITRTRLLADQILQGPWSEGLYGLNAAQTLAAFHLKAFQSRLETIKAEILVQLADNSMRIPWKLTIFRLQLLT